MNFNALVYLLPFFVCEIILIKNLIIIRYVKGNFSFSSLVL